MNKQANFDNVGYGLITLVAMGSLEGWPDIMYSAIDGRSEEDGPQKDANFWIALYFVSFILIGSFFFLNLFIGAICFNFDQAHKNKKTTMYSFLTEKQRK